MRTSQFESVHTIFCRVFDGGSVEKRIKILSFACAEIFAKLQCFFKKIPFQKLVSRFSQNMVFLEYLQCHSSSEQYEAKYFFLFESLCVGLAHLVALFSK
jgi:hypothetical protein